MASITTTRLDQSSEEPQFNLKEWGLRARISRENTNSRRFSASNLKSFREDHNLSFRSNFTISSTVSSPGFSLKDEIDPSTYSFNTALKALQGRTVYNRWDCPSPDGFALNSKWNEAEKYICNPLSGQFPLECLSAKSLSARSFRILTNRITMSAPLVYPSHHSRHFPTNPYIFPQQEEDKFAIPISVNKESTKKDVGTQSSETPYHPLKEHEPVESPICSVNFAAEEKVENIIVKEKAETKREENEEEREDEEEKSWRANRQKGCLPWMRNRQKEKHKHKKDPRKVFFFCLNSKKDDV